MGYRYAKQLKSAKIYEIVDVQGRIQTSVMGRLHSKKHVAPRELGGSSVASGFEPMTRQWWPRVRERDHLSNVGQHNEEKLRCSE
ncbi:hypothetical protein TNCV_2423121 [Trichonephila clavipes]|nr:hypothetical protein TNCV_2423121 [Trichonephila clavipes]